MKDDKVKQLELFKDVEEQVREIRVMIDKEGRMLKRQLKPNDVANLVLYLSSDVSSGCTKQNFIVDAGIT